MRQSTSRSQPFKMSTLFFYPNSQCFVQTQKRGGGGWRRRGTFFFFVCFHECTFAISVRGWVCLSERSTSRLAGDVVFSVYRMHAVIHEVSKFSGGLLIVTFCVKWFVEKYVQVMCCRTAVRSNALLLIALYDLVKDIIIVGRWIPWSGGIGVNRRCVA